MALGNDGPKRVLLVKSGHFIGGVIQHLFASREQTEVIEAAPANSRELLRMIEEIQPDIIVLDDTHQGAYLHNLARIMQAGKDLRVVVLHTNSNRVQVYQRHQLEVQQSADLFEIL